MGVFRGNNKPKGGTEMIEAAIAFILLFWGMIIGNSDVLIASGLFAIACNIGNLGRDK